MKAYREKFDNNQDVSVNSKSIKTKQTRGKEDKENHKVKLEEEKS